MESAETPRVTFEDEHGVVSVFDEQGRLVMKSEKIDADAPVFQQSIDIEEVRVELL